MRRWTVSILFGLLATSTAEAREPQLDKLQPPGARLDRPFTLTIEGQNLPQEAKIVSTLPAAFTPLVNKKEPSQKEQLLYLVEPHRDARPGVYSIRLHTANGLSNLLLFSLGVLPEYAELELEEPSNTNDGPQAAERVEAPVTINGTLAGPERDVYRFKAKKGDRLVLEVEARRLGSALDPVLQVLHPDGTQLAVNDDAPALGADSRLDLSFPADGDYLAVIHDARFSLQKDNFYRLKIGSFDYAEGLFPLGWKRGERTDIEWIGGRLDGTRTSVDLAGVDPLQDWFRLEVPGSEGLQLPLIVSDLPEVLEPDGTDSKALAESTVVNGRILEPGESDRYRLQVKPGEHWMVQLTAAGAGISRLFGVLTATDPSGEQIASAGDDIPDPNDFSLLSVGQTSSDPFLSFEVPEGVEEVGISIHDLVGQGGPAFSYRLLARRHPPDFALRLINPYINIPEGSPALLSVAVDRYGYNGPVQLHVSGAEVIAAGGYVPGELESNQGVAASQVGVISLTAQPGSSGQVSELEVWGEARLADGSVVRRRARGPGVVTAVRGGTGLPDITFRDPQDPFTAPWLGLQLPAQLVPPLTARLEVEGPREVRLIQGMIHEVEWKIESDEKGVMAPDMVNTLSPGAVLVNIVPKDRDMKYAKQGVTLLRTFHSAPVQRFDFVLSAAVKLGKTSQTIYSPVVQIEVVQGYSVELAAAGLQMVPGGRMEVSGKVVREEGFDSPVTLELKDLPAEVSCTPAELSAEQSEFRLECRAASTVAPGQYDLLLVSASSLKKPGVESVPYSISPLEAQLHILPGPEQPQPVRAER